MICSVSPVVEVIPPTTPPPPASLPTRAPPPPRPIFRTELAAFKNLPLKPTVLELDDEKEGTMVGGGLPLGRAEKEGCTITSEDVTQRQFESCRNEQQDKRTISRFFATRVGLGGAVEEGGTTDALTLAPIADAVVVPTLADPKVPRPTVPRAVGELPPLAPVVLPATLALAASRSSRSLMAAACLAWDEAVCRTAVDEDGRVDDGWEGATDDLSLAEDRVCWAGGGGGAGAMVGCRVWGLQERTGVASTGLTRLEQKPPKKSSASDSNHLRPLARRSALPSEDLNLVPQHPIRTPSSAAMAQKQASRQSQAISLKGSTKIVAEFFDFSVVRRPSSLPSSSCTPPCADRSLLAFGRCRWTEQHPVPAWYLPDGRLQDG